MIKPKAVRLLLYSGDLLAVDLGSFAVKILSMKAKERSLTVLGTAQREVWRELAAAKSDEEKAQVYADAIRTIMTERAFKPRNASVSLSGNTAVQRFLALPAGHKPDPDAGLPAEARALIPFEEPDAVVSILMFEAAKGDKQSQTEMMLTIAHKKTVHGAMDIVRKAGLRPAVIINDALALANAYEFFEGKKAAETLVLLNVGASSTSVGVLENGVPKAARIVNIAGNTLTRALKREFDIDLEDAEKLKIEHGLAVPKGKSPEEVAIASRVARTLRPAMKDLSGEIHRTIDVFMQRRPAEYPAIRRIVLAGGSAELKGFAEILAAETGLDVEIFRPMVNVPAQNGTQGIAPLAAEFAVSCGLALSNTLVRRTHKPRVNLVPRRTRRAAIISDITPGFWRLIAGPVAVVALLCAYGIWAVRVSHREAAIEQALELATQKEKAAKSKFMKKTTASAPVKKVVDPFAFLARLTITGVMGDSGNSTAMLNSGDAVYVARNGKLYDGEEAEVRGVSSQISDNGLVLTAGGRRYLIALPK